MAIAAAVLAVAAGSWDAYRLRRNARYSGLVMAMTAGGPVLSLLLFIIVTNIELKPAVTLVLFAVGAVAGVFLARLACLDAAEAAEAAEAAAAAGPAVAAESAPVAGSEEAVVRAEAAAVADADNFAQATGVAGTSTMPATATDDRVSDAEASESAAPPKDRARQIRLVGASKEGLVSQKTIMVVLGAKQIFLHLWINSVRGCRK